MLFTGGLLLLLYGYEIFNFSLSIDEEVFGDKNQWAWMVTGHGRWGTAVLTRVFPPIGNIPMISTILFCVGLGISAYVLARIFFRQPAAQYAFAGMFVAYPVWPHLAEFSISAWCIGVGCILLTLCLLLFLAEHLLADILAAGLLAFATGISETFFVWFLVLLCLRYLSVILNTAPSDAVPTNTKIPWLRSLLITLAALLIYFSVQRLGFWFAPSRLHYVQSFVRFDHFMALPFLSIARTVSQSLRMLLGYHRIYLGYGPVVMFLPLVGFLIIAVQLLRRGKLETYQRVLATLLLVAAFVLALTPILVSAGAVPVRALIALTPLIAFLAGIAFWKSLRLTKLMYLALGIALFICIWINVSLFYTDNLARQRDQVLATRIMSRVDSVVPNPPAKRMPFVVVAARPWADAGNFRKVEIFGDSYFDTGHEGGNPIRMAAYLRTLGVDTLEPVPIAKAAQHRAAIEAMPIWPAAGSVAMVEGMLVVKLGPLTSAWGPP